MRNAEEQKTEEQKREDKDRDRGESGQGEKVKTTPEIWPEEEKRVPSCEGKWL